MKQALNETDHYTIFSFKKEKPVFSFAIPTYKRPNELKRCINSIINIQRNVPIEIVISDNDPSKNEISIVVPFLQKLNDVNVVYVGQKKNVGGYANWNTALLNCSGKYIVLVHDDDFINPFYIKKVLPFFENSKLDNVDAVGVSLRKINFLEKDAENRLNSFFLENKKTRFSKINTTKMFYKFAIPLLGTAFKRESLFSTNLFPSNSKCKIEDYCFMTNFVKNNKCIKLSNDLYGYGIEKNDSLSNGIWDQIEIDQFNLRSNFYKCKKIGHCFFYFNNVFLCEKDIIYINSKFLNFMSFNANRKAIYGKLNVKKITVIISQLILYPLFIFKILITFMDRKIAKL